MSQQDVETFKRALEAFHRRDVDAVLEEIHPDVEWHPGMAVSLGGEVTVYRGREGARAVMRDLLDAFDHVHLEVSELRDLGDGILAIGQMHARGAESGAEVESPWAYVVRLKDGKAVWVRSYTDPREAREASRTANQPCPQ